MKKTLLLGTALMVGAMGFAQSSANRVHSNPAYSKKRNPAAERRSAIEPQPSGATGIKVARKNGHQSTSASCGAANKITTSWNCFGAGGGSYTSTQNCLSYNKDLNVAIWTQRGSKAWPIITSSGFIQATIINPTTGAAIDSIVMFNAGASTATIQARYPGGTILNPSTNTSNSYTNAIAISSGSSTNGGSNWIGTPYTAKPLWSKSARTHTLPTQDSLWANGGSVNGPIGLFGNDAIAADGSFGPSTDQLAMPDGKTVYMIGTIVDNAYSGITNASYQPKALLAKGTLDATGKMVNWTVDSTSLVPPARVGALGYLLEGEPRIAFGPDGTTGYVVFFGRLATDYGNGSADSTYSPIVYKSTDGGVTWTQKMAGYNWMCKHPEVDKNVGELKYTNLPNGNKRLYTFDPYQHGADVTVDVNNNLHLVTTVEESLNLTNGDIDSLAFSATYHYDYSTYHPIIWDFITDGNDWKTLFVDSILSAPIASDLNTNDSTNAISPMGGSSTLGVSGHITVSRSTDGSTIIYGWSDSDPGVLGADATDGATYNSNPDILMKAYNVNTNKVTATKNTTNIGECFYPFLADQSYSDGAGGWVVPAVYTEGDVITTSSPWVTYDASSQADYYYSNCGTFTAAEFSIAANIYNPSTAPCITGINKVNAFEASISNFPNPFSNTTTIAVTLTESKSFSVNVYNAIGTLVYSKKVSGNVGENDVTFDAGSLSSGVYYYTVNAGNQQATKKMVIQK